MGMGIHCCTHNFHMKTRAGKGRVLYTEVTIIGWLISIAEIYHMIYNDVQIHKLFQQLEYKLLHWLCTSWLTCLLELLPIGFRIIADHQQHKWHTHEMYCRSLAAQMAHTWNLAWTFDQASAFFSFLGLKNTRAHLIF